MKSDLVFESNIHRGFLPEEHPLKYINYDVKTSLIFLVLLVQMKNRNYVALIQNFLLLLMGIFTPKINQKVFYLDQFLLHG